MLMANLISNLPISPLFGCENRRPSYTPIHKYAIRGKQGHAAFTAKATTGNFEPSTSLNIVGSVRNVWDKPEDLVALLGVGFASVATLWASLGVITAIDKLPVIPGVFELIGILFIAERAGSNY
ncbi:hypothetical protein E3N88_22874 [Mikania micrantha]|uniref:Cyanobacterial aminoacyl-tRNA synthetase CAAD domain-containing protein n=1 Tax=Mikania micrantha TaxID=192012 RepID=A0A5N6ND40_9ASTR|nr:hypothetical protein E3N88_22874 [Mikania micrantha]